MTILKKKWTSKFIILVSIILSINISLYGCRPVPEPFTINKGTFQNNKVDLQDIKGDVKIDRKYDLGNKLTASIKATVHVPDEVFYTNISVKPNVFDEEKIVFFCMNAPYENIQKINTKEGLQTGCSYTYQYKLFALNYDDSYFTYRRSSQIQLTNSFESKNIYEDPENLNFAYTKEQATDLAIAYLTNMGLMQDMDSLPREIAGYELKDTDTKQYHIVFGKSFNKVPLVTEGYQTALSIQNRPVDGEYVSIWIDNEGVMAFDGILKQTVKKDQSQKVVPLNAILEKFDKYLNLMPFAIGTSLNIDNVEMKYVPILEKGALDNTEYVLTWCFSGDIDGDIPYSIEINALDGTIIY